MAKTLKQMSDELVRFHEDRGWKLEDSNQLIVSILIELGELAEHYQWESRFKDLDDAKKRELGYEFVDVLNYLMRLAHNSGIDIEKYWEEKMPKLAEKFPVGATSSEYQEIRENYRKTGKNKLYE